MNLEPTNPFADAGLIRVRNGDEEQWITPDDRWGIQVRRSRHDGAHLGWDVFTSCEVDGTWYVEAIHAKCCDTPTEAIEALARCQGWEDPTSPQYAVNEDQAWIWEHGKSKED